MVWKEGSIKAYERKTKNLTFDKIRMEEKWNEMEEKEDRAGRGGRSKTWTQIQVEQRMQ